MTVAPSPGQYIIPRHAVCSQLDSVLKIRVVFDALAQVHNDTSLNSCLYLGPKLQQYIVDVLTRFRVNKFAFTTDIYKMYRQILVLPDTALFSTFCGNRHLMISS